MNIEDFDPNIWMTPSKSVNPGFSNHSFVPRVIEQSNGAHVIALADGTVIGYELGGQHSWDLFLGYYAPLTKQAPCC